MNFSKIMAAGAIAAALAAAGPAEAQVLAPCGWPAPWPGYVSSARGYVPPYYALHPPVYYSLPVPRSYGYSPFAYPPGVLTPEVHLAPSEPGKAVVNPYVEPASNPVPADRTASQPARLVNPYALDAAARIAAGL